MKACKQFRQWIWLAIYNELQPDQQKLLEQHLKTCSNCQLEVQQAEKTMKLLHQKIQLEPTELQFKSIREELHQRLLFVKQNKRGRDKIWQIISMDFAPKFRLATALAMLVVGVFLGRLFLVPDKHQPQLTDLATPNISGVEFVQYNPSTKEVSIKFNTIGENIIRGNLAKPEIQHLLAQTLITDDRPNVRLKTVGVLSLIKTFDKRVVDALIEVLEKDENPGVRLKAAKLINSIPINSHIKNLLIKVLTRVLTNEKNPAIRIEAINGLSRIVDSNVTPVILHAAENDTSEYVRYKASQISNRIKIQRLNDDF